jgi:hypothetical protein
VFPGLWQRTPWAILLTKWSDDDSEPRSLSFYRDLFTETGKGTSNMVDFFDTMSHQTVDITGSKVHGWFTLNRARADYVGNTYPQPAGKLNRDGLVDLAKSTALSHGVDLSKFSGVVVVMNTETDLFGALGVREALCDPKSLMPMLLGQEMGHGEGLDHSRVDGSTEDYQDPWDVMSTWDSAHYVTSPRYTFIGPGLNAANMRNVNWLDEGRVWKSSSPAFVQQIELRPLHAYDLPGFLAAELPGTPRGFLVEFRPKRGWDAGFPRSAVFVHRLEDGHSYRMLGQSGQSDLVVGDSFTHGSDVPWLERSSVTVDEIGNDYAKVTLSHRPTGQPRSPFDGISGQLFGGVAAGGQGGIFVGGVLHRVPPRSPFVSVLEQIAAHQAADLIADPITRLEVKRSTLSSIVAEAASQLADLTRLETPPPPPEGFSAGERGPA